MVVLSVVLFQSLERHGDLMSLAVALISILEKRKRNCICINASLMIVYFFLSGEGMAAIPVIKHCVQQQPGLTILMTTTTFTAL